MAKEENNGRKQEKKEGKEMPAILKKEAFSEFIKKNKDKIKRISEANTVRNKDCAVVIPKDDEWRSEHEWDELFEELKIKR